MMGILRKINNNRGYSLTMVLAAFCILLILITTIGTFTAAETKQSLSQQRKTQAYYIARAGAAATADWITSLRGRDLGEFNSMKFPLHSQAQAFGEGEFLVSVFREGGALKIVSTGRIASGKNASGDIRYIQDEVSMVLTEAGGHNVISPFDMAVFGTRKLELTGGALIKGGMGTSSTQNGSVSISGGASMDKILIISGGNPNTIIDKPSDFRIDDKIVFIQQVPNYPVPILPAFPNNLITRHDIDLKGNDSLTINQGGLYNEIRLTSATKLTIDTRGQDIVMRIRNLDISNGHIIIKGTGKVKMYVEDIDAINGSLNNNGTEGSIVDSINSKQFELYYSGSEGIKINGATVVQGSIYNKDADIDITGGGKIAGDIISGGQDIKISGGAFVKPQIVYAPKAKIDMSGGGVVLGSIVGDEVSMSGGTRVERDSAPLDISIPIETEDSPGTGQSGYSLRNWH